MDCRRAAARAEARRLTHCQCGHRRTLTHEGKAETVLYARMSTHALLNRFGERMRATMYDLGQFPHTGGLPIMFGDQLIGAIGVGGAAGRDDEGCAHEALTKVIGPQPPLIVDEPPK